MATAVGAGAPVGCAEVTRGDESFRKEGVLFQLIGEDDPIDLDELNELFGKVAFPRRPHGKLMTAIRNSHTVLVATAANKSRWAKKGQIIGFASDALDDASSRLDGIDQIDGFAGEYDDGIRIASLLSPPINRPLACQIG